jgi:hypothetical protein
MVETPLARAAGGEPTITGSDLEGEGYDDLAN